MPLQYIYHLSDLHIRNGDKIYCRYEEYKSVFENTITSLKTNIDKNNLEFDDYIIIITGDIFHNKNNIGNYGLLLYKTFIQELLKFSRVYIFPGNHDLIQSDINQPSLVYSSTFDLTNLTILNETTSFKIDDIGFSYVSVENTLDNYKNSGRFQELPPFPDIKETVKYKIALFHGSFAFAKLYNGDDIKTETNPYPLEWIKDFDYVLLGDIHKRQIFNYKQKTICGYSGSLIQQNFGEDIIDHGYLLWNLQTKKIKEINVKNNIGYINIKENDKGDILIRKNGKYECLLEQEIKDNIDYFPKLIEIKTFSKINFENLNNLLKSYDINFTIISNLNERCLNLDITNDYNIDNILNDKDEIDNIIDNNYILSYFSKMLSIDKQNKLTNIIKNKELLLFDVNKYPDDLTDECIRRNKDIMLSITNCVKTDDIKELKQPFTIKYLEWEGLLCYENKNWVNMEDLDAKTFMIKGKNGTGKTAIYNILLIAIWGKINKESKTLTSIINCKKTSGYTIVDIEINNVMYRIKRDYVIKDKKEVLNHINLYKYINHKELVLEGKQNDKIELLFGNITSFLSSSMITQKVDNDILKFDVKKTLEIIDKAFNIDYIYNLYNLFKISINKYKDFKRLVESKKQVYEKLVSNCKIEIIDDIEMQKLNDELILKIKERDEILLLFDDIKIDIKNPKNLIILETDYLSLINLLDK
jgi:DNA repair exonuclease SbcCD nuclease subunit